MLPSNFKNDRIFVDFYKNSVVVGGTVALSASSFPIKLRKFRDFTGSYIFDQVQFTNNEVLILKAYRDLGPDVPAALIAEFFLSTSAIQAKYYPKIFYQIETVPARSDMFVDLYLSY
jgi:hypothetical protein